MHLIVVQCPLAWPSLTLLPPPWGTPLPPAPEIVPVLLCGFHCLMLLAQSNPQLRVRNFSYVKQPQMWGVNKHCSSLGAVTRRTKSQTGSWVPWTLHTGDTWNHSSRRGDLQELTQREMGEWYRVDQVSVGEALHTYPAGGKVAV